MGIAATAVDAGVLLACIHVIGTGPRAANIPALLAGAAVQFFGNRHWAFRAAGGSAARQLILFVLAEVVTLALNGLLYDFGVSGAAAWFWRIPDAAPGWWPVAVRLAATCAVFCCWSYPAWRLIFRTKDTDRTDNGTDIGKRVQLALRPAEGRAP